jgi:hypothetical protein
MKRDRRHKNLSQQQRDHVGHTSARGSMKEEALALIEFGQWMKKG